MQHLICFGSSGLGNTSSRTGDSHLERDAALGAGGFGTASALHHHHDRERDTLGSDTTGRSFPLGGHSTSTTGSGYPSTITGNTTAGPHSSNLANKADPRVDSDLDGSRNMGGTGLGSGTGPTTGSSHQGHLGRDAAVGAGSVGASGLAEHELRGDRGTIGTGVGYGPESWEHDHKQHGHQFGGDPCGSEGPAPGPHFSKGPHGTDTANLLDPHVASPVIPIGSTSGTGNTGSTTGTGIGSTSGTSVGSTGTGSNHLGRDAAVAGGVGTAGVGAYEAGRGSSDPSTSAGSAPNTAGPHKSDMLNKLDPRVDSDMSKQQSSTGTTGTSGIGGTSTTGTSGYPSTSSTTGRDHHLGRDAGLIGAGGAAAYEADKHHHNKESGLTGTSRTTNPGIGGIGPDYSNDSAMRGSGTTATPGHDNHLGRDAGLAGAGGVTAYEAEKHHGHHHPSGTTASGYENPYPRSTVDPRVDSTERTGTTGATPTIGSTDHHYGRDAGLAGTGGAAAYEAEKHHHNKHDPTITTGISSDPNQPTSTGHHYGRDAGLVGAGGAAAYKTDKHHDKHHDKYDPTTTTGTSTHGDHHHGRDAAIAGGVGAVGGAEFSKKEAEKIQKEQEKEHKKHIKEEEKHMKEHEKHEKHDEKKHGGLLGKLFHHNKADKEERKEEKLEREGLSDTKHHGHHHGAETAAGVGAVGAAGAGLTETERHHEGHEHERNRLHKDPPGGLNTDTEYASAPTSGYASQVTGGTGTTALAQGESVERGSHLTGVGNKLDPR